MCQLIDRMAGRWMLDSRGQGAQLEVQKLALVARTRRAGLPTNLEAAIGAPRRTRRSSLYYQRDFRCDVPSSRRFLGELIALVRRCRANYGRDIYLGASESLFSPTQYIDRSTNLSKYKSSPLLIVVSRASVGGSSCRRNPRARSLSLHFSRSSFTVGVVRSVAVAHALESTIYSVQLVSDRLRSEVNCACTIFLFVTLMQSSTRKSLMP